ncbi:MAG: hypothetical protein WBD31_00565 [Rubripirellula sp.]
MRTPFIIAALIACAIGVEALLAMIHPVGLLPLQLCADIGDYGMTASLFVIPALFVFAPSRSPSGRRWSVRILLAVLTSWFATMQFRMQFNLPALREIAYQRDDHMYDGVGLNAALLMMGWIPPLVVTIILVAVARLFIPGTDASDSGASVSGAALEATEPRDSPKYRIGRFQMEITLAVLGDLDRYVYEQIQN